MILKLLLSSNRNILALLFLLISASLMFPQNDLFSSKNVEQRIHKSDRDVYDGLFFLNNTVDYDTLRILPIGNSITFDKRTNDPREDGDKFGYRLPLQNLLLNAGLSFDFIGSEKSGWNYLLPGLEDNAGFPGIKDDQLANLLSTGWRIQPPSYNDSLTPGPYLETYTPDLILLHIGTNGNDLSGGTNVDDINDILNEVDSVEQSLDMEIPVVIAQIIDRVPNQQYVNELNNNIDSLVTDRTSNSMNPAYPDNIFIVNMEDSAQIIYAIDSMGTVGNGLIGDMNDMLHPNDKGFVKIADVFFDAVADVIPNPIDIVQQPSNQGTVIGAPATFSVVSASEENISYQWIKNGEEIFGATDSILTTPPATMEDNDSKYICEIRSKYYTVYSDTVSLSVTDSTQRVMDGLIAYYDFEEGKGDLIANLIDSYSDLDMFIDDTMNIEWIPHGLKVMNASQIFTNETGEDLAENLKGTNEITIEAWIEPENELQSGPARIITFSDGISNRNFTLGQIADTFEVRLRTAESSNNGKPALTSTDSAALAKLTHVVFTRNRSGEAKLYLDNVINKTDTIPGLFSNWDSTYKFGISNEFMDERIWLGKFYLVSIYDRALSSFEVAHNYNFKFNGFGNFLDKPSNLTFEIENLTDVIINWEDNSSEELGYLIERRLNREDSSFVEIDTVDFDVTVFADTTTKIDSSYIYRIRAYNSEYFSDYSEELLVTDLPVSVNYNEGLVSKFNLYQNYPNPFNPTTQLKFDIAKKSNVELKIFNSLGQVVRIIHSDEILPSGNYNFIFNGSNLASGVYFYRLIAKPVDGSQMFISTNKAVLVK